MLENPISLNLRLNTKEDFELQSENHGTDSIRSQRSYSCSKRELFDTRKKKSKKGDAAGTLKTYKINGLHAMIKI